MRLVSKEGGIATRTVVPDEVKPLQGLHLVSLFQKVVERYGLAVQPTLEETRETGARFRTGRLVKDGKEIPITELAIFNDGFSVTTTDTSDSELVLDDLLPWLRNTFGFRDAVSKVKRAYQSDVVVDFDHNMEAALAPILSLKENLQREFEAVSGIKRTFYFDFLGFIAEDVPPTPMREFMIQRRIGAPLDAKRYFSKAHLPTAAHLKILEKLDSLLEKSKKS